MQRPPALALSWDTLVTLTIQRERARATNLEDPTMRAISLPTVDGSTIDGITKNLPSMRDAGDAVRGAGQKGAASLRRWRSQAMDRAQPQRPIRPWVASGVFTIALLGALFALLTWSRRPGSSSPDAETQANEARSTGGPDLEDRLDDELP
jgi:hypothetical protein